MKRWIRIATQVLIGAFFFWHAAAVGTFAIPLATVNPLASLVRNAGVSVFANYLLWSSQWQQWNLFSPDPMRRVSEYKIEKLDGDGNWQAIDDLNPNRYSWVHHANYFKMYIGILESDQSTYNPVIVRHFVQGYCAADHVPAGATLHIAYLQYIITQQNSLLQAFVPDSMPHRPTITYSDPIYCP